MPFPVYVEATAVLTPSDVAQGTGALLTDCTAALRDEQCVLGAPTAPPMSALEARRALVVVRGPAAEQVEIWVYHGDGTVSYRELRFTPRDPLQERWRTAGLLTASLLRVPDPAAPRPPARPTSPRAETAAAALPKRAPSGRGREHWGAWIAGVSGTWSTRAPWLFGGTAGGEAYPIQAPLGVVMSGELSRSFAELSNSVRVSRRCLALGLVTTLPKRARVRVVFRAQLMREWLTASATEPTRGQDAGQTARTGGSLALVPSIEVKPGLSAHFGAQMALFTTDPTVFVGDVVAARASRLTTTFFVGIRSGF